MTGIESLNIVDFSEEKLKFLEDSVGEKEALSFIDKAINHLNSYAEVNDFTVDKFVNDESLSLSFVGTVPRKESGSERVLLKVFYCDSDFKRELIFYDRMPVAKFSNKRYSPRLRDYDGENRIILRDYVDEKNATVIDNDFRHSGLSLQYMSKIEISLEDMDMLPELEIVLKNQVLDARKRIVSYSDYTRTRMCDLLETLPREIERLIELSRRKTFVHGNLTPSNVREDKIINPKGYYGDRFYDLAHWVYYSFPDSLHPSQEPDINEVLEKTIYYMAVHVSREYVDKYVSDGSSQDIQSKIREWVRIIAILNYAPDNNYQNISKYLIG